MKETKVGVIGCGMMGASIAAMFTGNGINTILIGRKKSLNKAAENYDTVFEDLMKKNIIEKRDFEICKTYLHISYDYKTLEDVDFIFECVVEKLDVKQSVYTNVEKYCKKLKVLASSTSGISVDVLASILTKYKDIMFVAHPWNPPHLVPCIEIVRSKNCSDHALKYILSLFESLNKEVIVLNKDYPGFIGNRLQYAMLREAIFMVEQGIATPQMIDKTLKYSFAPRYTQIGIFEHFDNCGQDLAKDVQQYLNPTLCNSTVVQKSIVENCDLKKYGVKSGGGMLDWSNVDLDEFRDRAASAYYQFFNWNIPTKKIDEN